MKKMYGATMFLMIMIFALGLASMANAQPVLVVGDIAFKFNDVTFFDIPSDLLQPGQAAPTTPSYTGSGRSWGIANVASVHTLLSGGTVENPILNPVPIWVPSAGDMLQVRFGGLILSHTSPLAPAFPWNAYYVRDSAAYLTPAGNAYIEVYSRTSDGFIADVMAGPGDGTYNSFGVNIATGGTLYLDLKLQAGVLPVYDILAAQDDLEITTVNALTTAGTLMYSSIVGGTAAGSFGRGIFPLAFPLYSPRADIRLKANLTAIYDPDTNVWTNPHGWMFDSEDPVTGTVVPEAVPSCEIVKTCKDAPNADGNITISATLKNTGSEQLTGITCSDDPTVSPLNGVPTTLDPNATANITGSYKPAESPSTDTLTCSGTGAISGNEATCSDAAKCKIPGVGQCRMTGGSETEYDFGALSFGPTYLWVPGTYASDTNGNVLITTGGQIGAPMASPTGPSFGEWEHVQHCPKKNGVEKCTGNTFGFDFKAGTASGKAKDTTIINSVLCGDEGWCTQARCAPFKQIFWDGIGLVKNLVGNGTNPFTACGGENSLHYFQAHVGDFGEPGSNDIKKRRDAGTCPWTSGGVDISDIVLLSPVSPAPDPFGSKGGEICPAACGDWYEIEIHCDSTPGSAIIYRFASFIDTGNLQIHPPVGQHCVFE